MWVTFEVSKQDVNQVNDLQKDCPTIHMCFMPVYTLSQSMFFLLAECGRQGASSKVVHLKAGEGSGYQHNSLFSSDQLTAAVSLDQYQRQQDN